VDAGERWTLRWREVDSNHRSPSRDCRRARNSSFTYKGQAVDVKQVGRELGVRYVLEGSVRKASCRVRITGQLIDAVTSVHLWADRFDGSLEDVFDLLR
jgi:TolB-like protein